MVKVLGRAHKAGSELAYKVMARGYAFEVSVKGKRFNIRELPGEGRMPYGAIAAAFEEVSKFLGARCMALAGVA